MRGARILFLILVTLTLASCSRSGAGGAGTPGDGMGEGNIPLAQAGGELGDIYFAFDSSELDSSARDALRKNASWLSSNPGQHIVVEGHCDERGTAEYNLALGERRANAVATYVSSLGVKAQQLSTISYGEELPLDTNHSESAWAKNRRAHFAFRK